MKMICKIGGIVGLLLAQMSVYGDSQEVLYSINLPGNPFQQPYFQVMTKGDNSNSTIELSQIMYTQTNPSGYETGNWNKTTWVTSDYVSYYWNSGDVYLNNEWYTLVYGLSPYTVRGYSEGAASSLHLQRPAQVQLPFIPNGGSTVYATFPDYSDMFLAQTAEHVSSQVCGNNCGFSPSKSTLGAWYKYNPAIHAWSPAGGHCHNACNHFGAGTVGYGSLEKLSQRTSQNVFGTFYASGANYWPQTCSWWSYVGWGYSHPTLDYVSNCSWPAIAGGSYSFFPQTLPIAPIITPGNQGYTKVNYTYMNETLDATLLSTVPEGDLGGNFSGAVNMYQPNATQSYSAITMQNMNYFQLFAQNMQWFTYQNNNYNSLYATPGQGIFSDAMQLAAAEAVPVSSSGNVFTGSTGVSGITGPLLLTELNCEVPAAFLSKVTVNSFLSGIYFSNAASGWTGALGPQEAGFEYYIGVMPHSDSMLPYLPVYFSDPGRGLSFSNPENGSPVPGENYCSAEDFQEVQMNQSLTPQLYVSRDSSPMTNCLEMLSGTRKRR